MGRIKVNDSSKWALVLLMLAWCYVSFFGETILLFQNDQYLFLYTRDYLNQFLNLPGGVGLWLSAFFTQFYYFPLLGAFVVSIIVTCTFLSLVALFKKFNTPNENSFAILPSFILISIFQNYESSLLLMIAVLINLVVVRLYVAINRSWLRLMLGIVVLIILYLSIGAFFWLFVVIATLIEVFVFKGYKSFINATLLLAVSLLLPYFLALHHYYIFIEPAYLHPLKTKVVNSIWQLGIIITVMVLALLASKFGSSLRLVLQKKYWLPHIITALVFCMGVTYVVKNHNAKVSTILNIAQAGKNQQWDEVLEIAKQTNINNLLIPYYTNLALAHKGDILNQLFIYPQKAGVKGLYHTWENNQHLKQHGGAFFYSLGYVNEAHHWAFESLVETGPVAPVLKDLVRCNLVMGKTKNAQKYINVLKQSLFHHQWAVDTEQLCRDTTLLSQTTWVQDKRNQIPSGDYFMDLKGYEKDLLNIVQCTPNNKSALDYLIAFYLLSNQPEKVINNLDLIRTHYSTLPAAVQEVCVRHAPALVTDQNVSRMYEVYKIAFESKRFNPDSAVVNTFWYYADFVFQNQGID